MISIIAAIGKNRELGKDNKLLWHIPEDFKRFKALTLNSIVIMGRKTFESLPEKFQPLPFRTNIIISKNFVFHAHLEKHLHEVKVYHSTEEAIERAKELAIKDKKRIFIIGGASIYEQGIKYADKLYLTLVDKDYPDADTFFPEYGEFGNLKLVGEGIEDNLHYKFVEILKKY